MNKRVLVLIVSVVLVTPFAYASGIVQGPTPAVAAVQPTPAPQATPAPSPTPQAAQKPTPALATPPPAQAQPPMVPFPPNVRVDVTITDQTGSAAAIKKSVSVTANRSGSVRAGVNVPIPSSTSSGTAGAPVMSSYSYRTMGLNLDVMEVEVREPGAPATTPVSYSNFSQTFYLVLDNGKPIVAAITSDPVPNRNRTLSVEVKATILK